MKASQIFPDDLFEDARKEMERNEKWWREQAAVRRRREREEAAQEALVKRIETVMREHGVDWDRAGSIIADEDMRDRLIRSAWDRQAARQAAEEEREAMRWVPGLYPPEDADDTSERKEIKSSPIALSKASATSVAAGRFSGLASTFGAIDSTGDVVEYGAFARSLAAAKAKGRPFLFPVLYQHQVDKVIGGVVAATERPDGLWVECSLDRLTRDGSEAWSLVAGGYLDGLSIGFLTKHADYRHDARHLTEIELLEVSLVTWPAAEGARVTGTGS